MLWNFTGQEWRKDIGKMNLLCASEIAARQIKVLRHRTELDVVSAQDVPELAQSFLGAHVGARVAGSVVAGKKQLQLLAGLPWLPGSQHPTGLGALDGRADPGLQDEIHHAADPPAVR